MRGIVLLLLLGTTAYGADMSAFYTTADPAAFQVTAAADGPRMVFLEAPGCPPCKRTVFKTWPKLKEAGWKIGGPDADMQVYSCRSFTGTCGKVLTKQGREFCPAAALIEDGEVVRKVITVLLVRGDDMVTHQEYWADGAPVATVLVDGEYKDSNYLSLSDFEWVRDGGTLDHLPPAAVNDPKYKKGAAGASGKSMSVEDRLDRLERLVLAMSGGAGCPDGCPCPCPPGQCPCPDCPSGCPGNCPTVPKTGAPKKTYSSSVASNHPRSTRNWTFPGNSRSDLIRHLRSGPHAGKFSTAELNAASYETLKQWHNADHNRMKYGSSRGPTRKTTPVRRTTRKKSSGLRRLFCPNC